MFGFNKNGYVSDVDLFLKKIRKEIPMTEAQAVEVKKYQKINYLRDHEVAKEGKPEFWEDF